MQAVVTILYDILDAFSHYIIPASLFAVLATVVMNYLQRFGWKQVIKEWCSKFKNHSVFRARLLFCIYLYFLFDYTLLSRTFIWDNPLQKWMDGWWLGIGSNGKVNYEFIENIIFFIPYLSLLYVSFPKLREYSWWKQLKLAFSISFGTSLLIETIQLITRLGAFQLSDLTYNTLGGIMGFLLFCLVNTIKKAVQVKSRKQSSQ